MTNNYFCKIFIYFMLNFLSRTWEVYDIVLTYFSILAVISFKHFYKYFQMTGLVQFISAENEFGPDPLHCCWSSRRGLKHFRPSIENNGNRRTLHISKIPIHVPSKYFILGDRMSLFSFKYSHFSNSWYFKQVSYFFPQAHKSLLRKLNILCSTYIYLK